MNEPVAALQRNNENLRKEIERLTALVSELRAQVATSASEGSSDNDDSETLLTQLDAAQREKNTLTNTVERLDKELASANEKLKGSQNEIDQLRAELRAKSSELEKLNLALHKLQQQAKTPKKSPAKKPLKPAEAASNTTRGKSSTFGRVIQALEFNADEEATKPFPEQIANASKLRNRTNGFLALCDISKRIKDAPEFGFGSVSDEEKKSLQEEVTEHCADLLLALAEHHAVATCLSSVTDDIDLFGSLQSRNQMTLELLTKFTADLLTSENAESISTESFERGISTVFVMWAKKLSNDPMLSNEQAESFLTSSEQFNAQLSAIAEANLTAQSEQLQSTQPSSPRALAGAASHQASPAIEPSSPKTPAATHSLRAGDTDLFTQIKAGKQLKPVELRTPRRTPGKDGRLVNLLSEAIERSMRKRREQANLDREQNRNFDDSPISARPVKGPQ